MWTLAIFWDPSPAISSFEIPLVGRPILWYGFFFALGFFLAYLVFQRLLFDFMGRYKVEKKISNKFAEKFSLYVVIGAIVGARLGDVLFYQSLSDYANDPLGIFRFWEGGLASHGGIAGVLLSLFVLSVRVKKSNPMMSWVAMLDLLAIPALLAGGCIRIGNFFNQEILGTPTSLPWGVVFGHPVGGALPVARHPVQLYEAFFYFALFAALLFLRKRGGKMAQTGKTSGLLLIVTFAFRFLIEFTKTEQSVLLGGSGGLAMGQLLSVPILFFGLYLFFGHKDRLGSRPVEGE